jgi:hypothetical protein
MSKLGTIATTTSALAAASAIFALISIEANAQSVNVWTAGQDAYRECMQGAQTPGKADYCAWRRCLAEMAHTPKGSDPAVLAGAGPCLPLLRAFEQSQAPNVSASTPVDVPGAALPSKSPPDRPLGAHSANNGGGTFTPYTPPPSVHVPPPVYVAPSRPPVVVIDGPIRGSGWSRPPIRTPGPSAMGPGYHRNPVPGALHRKVRGPFVNRGPIVTRAIPRPHRIAAAPRILRGPSPMMMRRSPMMGRSPFAGRRVVMRFR